MRRKGEEGRERTEMAEYWGKEDGTRSLQRSSEVVDEKGQGRETEEK